ncbi:MAG: hypothetical protein JW966_11095 [Anaerolineae bacterium]|nr:hypothetical protein [Anaerolineae bacterium]
MPVTMEWDTSLPILHITLSGELSSREYDNMAQQREAMLAAGPAHVILLVNTHNLDSFPTANLIRNRESITQHDKVACTFIIITDRLYRMLMGPIMSTQDLGLAVRFYRDASLAYEDAQKLASR